MSDRTMTAEMAAIVHDVFSKLPDPDQGSAYTWFIDHATITIRHRDDYVVGRFVVRDDWWQFELVEDE